MFCETRNHKKELFSLSCPMQGALARHVPVRAPPGEIMKKVFLAFLALATALAITPAALADSLFYTFTSPNGSTVFAAGFLNGTNVGGNQWDVTSGSLIIEGGGPGLVTGTTGTVIGGTGSQLTSPSGAFYYDNEVFLPVGLGSPYVDNNGLLFDIDGVEVNIYSNNGFTGAGTNDYMTYEYDGTKYNFDNNGELNIIDVTPEPSSLLLLGSGLLGLAFVAFRKAKPAGPILHN
jgi:hypothetical protein